jgi:hypothetical protein
MTYLHMHDQGLPKHALGERRNDQLTAEKVRDALRAHGLPAAAQAMACQQVRMDVALRVLATPGRRRGQAGGAATPRAPQAARSQAADFADFIGTPA